MPSRARALLLIAVSTACFACPARPASFRVVELAEAQLLAGGHALILVEATQPKPRVPKESTTQIPSGVGVLVFGDDASATHARAAELARAGNHPVLVFVPRNAEERGRFYAVASPAEESQRGEDS